jgi:hypothetical protein
MVFAGVTLGACAVAPATLRRMVGDRAPAAAPVRTLCDQVAAAERPADAERALAELLRRRPPAGDAWTVDGCRVGVDAGAPGSYALDYFDELTPAADFAVTALPHHRREGIGVALLGLRENRQRDPLERHFPPEAITRPVTAVADAGLAPDGTRTVRILLLSPLHHETVLSGGRPQPLAADFTVPWVALLQRTGTLRSSWLASLLARRPARPAQLYLMEPYDPDKAPLLLVHGLLSTPIDWAAVTNTLWADAAVRGRYQVWHYHYPTAAPFLYSARGLRQRLDEVRALLRQEGHADIRPLTVLAHSMGGLLAKTLVTDSGEAVWDTVFTRPSDALRAAPDDLATVTDILHWQARPHVRRVIFVAVPHRGSDMARGLLGRLGDALAGVPPEFAGLYARLDRDNPGALAPAFRPLARGALSSIDTLSPRHPLLPVLDALPVAPWVTVHSIIGDRAGGSDGVVPYTSSHLPGAASELVVPAGHAAYEHPAAMADIRRILALP